jgi:hypothetical protein
MVFLASPEKAAFSARQAGARGILVQLLAARR